MQKLAIGAEYKVSDSSHNRGALSGLMQKLNSNLNTKTTLETNSGQLGEIHDCPFYIARDQFELWQDTHLTIDIVPGRGASFSAEIPLGVRFVTKSRVYNDAERADLRPVGTGSDNVC